jgi:hypothetical protein
LVSCREHVRLWALPALYATCVDERAPNRFDSLPHTDAEKLALRIGSMLVEKIVCPTFDGAGP